MKKEKEWWQESQIIIIGVILLIFFLLAFIPWGEDSSTQTNSQTSTKNAVEPKTKQECIDKYGESGYDRETDTGYSINCKDDGTYTTTAVRDEPEVYERNIQPDSAESCNIKGNISYNTGEKIYHVPGQRYYDATNIDTAYGEKMFCSEQEAINSGWRKAYE